MASNWHAQVSIQHFLNKMDLDSLATLYLLQYQTFCLLLSFQSILLTSLHPCICLISFYSRTFLILSSQGRLSYNMNPTFEASESRTPDLTDADEKVPGNLPSYLPLLTVEGKCSGTSLRCGTDTTPCSTLCSQPL